MKTLGLFNTNRMWEFLMFFTGKENAGIARKIKEMNRDGN
jgi:hypothetical protein